MKEFHYKLKDLKQIGQQIIDAADHKILLVYGEMGVGKTTLIKALVHQLGSEDVVRSPTFSLVNEYASKKGPIFHFDFYRIEDEMEALDIGVEEYFNSGAWIFIEWPEKISRFLPEYSQAIYLERTQEDLNKVKLG